AGQRARRGGAARCPARRGAFRPLRVARRAGRPHRSAVPGRPPLGAFRKRPMAALRGRLLAPTWMALLVACLVALGGCSRDGDAIRGSGTIEMDEVDVA